MMWSMPIIGLPSLVWLLARRIPRARGAPAAARACVGVAAVAVTVLGVGLQSGIAQVTPPIAWGRPDPANAPIGVAQGVSAGRVAWVHDPDATDWAGPGMGAGHWWEPGHTDQAVVDSMMSRAVCLLAGKATDREAWDALFRYFNQTRGKGDIGYQRGEKIAIKINLSLCHGSSDRVDPTTRAKTGLLDGVDTSQYMVLAMLRQLVNVVGAAQEDIAVGDTGSYFPKEWYDHMAPEFPNVKYLDHYAFPGRTQVSYSTTPLHFSTPRAAGKLQDFLPVSFAEASYIINFAALKGHAAGMTVCGKNHYGSLIRGPDGWVWGEKKNYYDLHQSLPLLWYTPGRGHYRAVVDLMGHDQLGGKTVLYLIDGLYGGYYFDGTPYKWKTPPFNGDWPSSLFTSQDPVAIDSVAYDFLLAEWPQVVCDGQGPPDGLQGGAQDYLHEAALANKPPSGTFYDPEADGTPLSSLGVHEHWNNAADKQYSRNLGVGQGIELISSPPHMPGAVRTAGRDEPR